MIDIQNLLNRDIEIEPGTAKAHCASGHCHRFRNLEGPLKEFRTALELTTMIAKLTNAVGRYADSEDEKQSVTGGGRVAAPPILSTRRRTWIPIYQSNREPNEA